MTKSAAVQNAQFFAQAVEEFALYNGGVTLVDAYDTAMIGAGLPYRAHRRTK